GVSHEVVLWVALVYPLLGGSLLLTWGRLGDIAGRERIFTLGFPVTTIGLVLCAVAPNIVTLIIFRMIQVTGLSLLVSLAPAIASAALPVGERGKALGIYFAIFGAGSLIGPLLGGFLIDHLSWQAIFYFQLPVTVIGLVLAFSLLRRQPPAVAERGFDIRGAVILLVGLSSLILAVNQGRMMGWLSPFVLGLGVAALVLFSLFLVVERRTAQPLLDLRLFKNRVFASATSASFLIFISMFIFMLVMPFYLMEGAGYSATTAGMVAMIYAGVPPLMFPLSGWLGDKLGPALLCPLGLVIGSVGLFLVSGLGADSSTADIVYRITVWSFGWGLFLIPNSSAIIGSVPQDRLGSASAMMTTARQIGMALGSALGMTLFASLKISRSAQLVSEGMGQETVERMGVVAGLHGVILVAMGTAILALVFSLLMGKRPSRSG
ncbi:DHA2 family efflux MFS transporter permease subunit, partial [Chloroflexota bacterium]